MELSGRKFLVTGGAGFIGSHLVDTLLREGAGEVVVFDNLVRGTQANLDSARHDPRLKVFPVERADLMDRTAVAEAVQGVHGVFHMASHCLGACQENPRAGFDANVVGTYNLLEACVANDRPRVLFSSSSSVYGNARYVPMDEQHPFNNRNFYGAGKICGEALCRVFHAEYGLPYVALRYMNVYGPRQDYRGTYVAVIMRIIDRLHQGLPPIVNGDGSQRFDFVYVEDVCRANLLAMEKDATVDEAINISSGSSTSVLELCRRIMALMQRELPVEFVPQKTDVLVTHRVGSTEKAATLLGFTASTPLDEGLRQTIRWKLNRRDG
ncbi:MAG: hypothetical protein A3K19_12960 [Lentisphaerae bacterium RIFOXYB12_FULL_65_16]|nr:MAG: hypothetical protein A3K18_04745 [Lentisphaerae bacterium RIFOXYA12_64_32]OGV87222.1 MAG: hypothetical protein A3K19_12960 [Lentisphaerae bacterium RIFOXYB12_FULL_65_16]